MSVNDDVPPHPPRRFVFNLTPAIHNNSPKPSFSLNPCFKHSCSVNRPPAYNNSSLNSLHHKNVGPTNYLKNTIIISSITSGQVGVRWDGCGWVKDRKSSLTSSLEFFSYQSEGVKGGVSDDNGKQDVPMMEEEDRR